MAEPTNYDLIQDGRLGSLESLITAEYEPPAGAQYSYPIANHGITQDQFRQMNLHTGDGVVVTDEGHHSFYLEPHNSDAETNARNTLLLKVSRETGRNEAILAGFYFRQTEDIELPFPAVTSTTTYYVTVTYDPRKFKTEPLRVEVWAGDPPRANGQRHIVLHTVVRQPNQVLSQAVREMHRQYVSPVISVHHRDRLPEPTDVLYGSIAVKANQTVGGVLRPGTGELWESRGQYGWSNLLVGPWHQVTLQGGWRHGSTPVQVRRVPGGAQMKGIADGRSATFATTVGLIPADAEGTRPQAAIRIRPWIQTGGGSTYLQAVDIAPSGAISLRLSKHDYPTNEIFFDGVIYHLD